ncbi:MAG: SMC-Scp complex subunit ScpB [Patescibacteria group bacterium]
MSVKSQLESILFVAIKPLTSKELANLVEVKTDEVKAALEELVADYKTSDRGFALIQNNGQYQLTTSAENSDLVKNFLKDEISGELSQPSLEALTIIAYRGPISKLELDRIRGVNCSLIIRNLLLRGLIEEKFNKTKNENYYTVTNDFIRFLGLSSLDDLPDYAKLNKLESLNTSLTETEKEVEEIIETKNIENEASPEDEEAKEEYEDDDEDEEDEENQEDEVETK